MTALAQAATQRIRTIKATSEVRRDAFAQHLTPPETAALAASFFSETRESIDCLDLGAGTGILSAALIERFGGRINKIDAIEADAALSSIYDKELRGAICGHTITGDALIETPATKYDRIILNPPYKKMASADPRQKFLPVKSANLYSAFLAIALSRLKDFGEAVAIIPRSWMNGDYFAPFRKWAFSSYSLDAIHVYGSRTEVFKDTAVLQETMIVRFSKRSQADTIIVTQSDTKVDHLTRFEYEASQLIDSTSKTVRIAPQQSETAQTIATIGLCPSTGKVVDFRSRDLLSFDKPDVVKTYPLIYAGNFRTGQLVHPATIGKPQWYTPTDSKGLNQVLRPGYYTVVKRFSSKEEKRRVVAYPVEFKGLSALENHTNYIHQGTPRNTVPLESLELAQGIALWLNTSFIDSWFRDVSGSTQVNAGDIKQMPSPTMEQLKKLGKEWMPRLAQEQVDKICEEYL